MEENYWQQSCLRTFRPVHLGEAEPRGKERQCRLESKGEWWGVQGRVACQLRKIPLRTGGGLLANGRSLGTQARSELAKGKRDKQQG